jgi:hypothetical protein
VMVPELLLPPAAAHYPSTPAPTAGIPPPDEVAT